MPPAAHGNAKLDLTCPKYRRKVKEAIKMAVGNASKAAEIMGISKTTFYDHMFSDPELNEYLEEIRKQGRELELDECEETLQFIVKLKEKDTTNALKAVMYKLNNNGSKRGYGHAEVLAAKEQKALADNLEGIVIAPDKSDKSPKNSK